jgi:hypothetical protein
MIIHGRCVFIRGPAYSNFDVQHVGRVVDGASIRRVFVPHVGRPRHDSHITEEDGYVFFNGLIARVLVVIC